MGSYDSAWAAERSIAELLRISRVVLAELTQRGILRTANAPAGDLAEYIVAAAYQGELAPNSEKSWDVRSQAGRRLQVKSRVLDRTGGGQTFSPFRSFSFDAAVFVVLSPADLSVSKAVEMPAELVSEKATYRAHVNGHIVSTAIVDSDDERVIDVTHKLRDVMNDGKI